MKCLVEELLTKLMQACGLGNITSDIESVSGGFLHRMYKVQTESGTYAVKHLNAEIMKRPAARENFARAERIEAMLEENGVPIVPALVFGGKKMQNVEGQFFYVFRWQNGRITDWNGISEKQCYEAGNILGRIHSIESREMEPQEAEASRTDWQQYIRRAGEDASSITTLLEESESLCVYAESERNRALASLPPYLCISNEDMDPKNIMWDKGEPWVIDLECLDYGNPASHAMQLSLQWSGITTCQLDFNKMLAFWDGYLAAYDNRFRDYEDIFGVAYSWVDWLKYNIERALGNCMDETERETGISEVKNTLQRIAYIKEQEPGIKAALHRKFGDVAILQEPVE